MIPKTVTHQISRWGGSVYRTVAWKDRYPHRPPSRCHPGSGLQVQVGYDPLVLPSNHPGCTGPDRQVLGNHKVTGEEECRIGGSCGAHFQNEAQKSVVGKVWYSVMLSAWRVQRTISKDLGHQCYGMLMGLAYAKALPHGHERWRMLLVPFLVHVAAS